MIFYWIEESGIHQTRGIFENPDCCWAGRLTSSDHFAYLLLLLPFFTIHREKEKKRDHPRRERERNSIHFYSLYVGFVS
jgi:hypothetical protein